MTIKQKDSENPCIALSQATEALRRQNGLVIMREDGSCYSIYAAEFLDDELFSELKNAAPKLLITPVRARYLQLKTMAPCIAIAAEHFSLAQVRALADPTLDGAPNVTGFAENTCEIPLALCKRAGLLPAVLVVEKDVPRWPHVAEPLLKIALHNAGIQVFETARANLPIEGAEHSVLASFREQGGDAVHLALLIGNPEKDMAPLTRVHSSCVTGDLLGSMRCDCGDQLALALHAIKQAGSGILLYLNQEGRGIGITNKLRAYQLQERGIDTYDANLMLGFYEDERDFSAASAMLKSLGISTITLLSNNPEKVSVLEKTGITVAKREKLIAPAGAYNHAYIDAKIKKAGHIF